MQIFLTVIGPANIFIGDLGEVTFDTGTTNLPLIEPDGEFYVEDIQFSEDLQAAITAGTIQLTDDNGTVVGAGDVGNVGSTDLSLGTVNTTDVTIRSSTGDSVVLPGATEFLAGTITAGGQVLSGAKTFKSPMVIGEGSLGSGYLLSIQDQDNDGFAYIEILSDRTGSAFGGASKGAFFGMEDWGNNLVDQEFALYNWQGGPIVFWTDTAASSGVRRLQIENNGRISIPGAQGGSPGTLNYETLVDADNVIPNKKYVDDAIATSGGPAVSPIYKYDNTLTAGPSSGQFRLNSLTPGSVTQLFIHEQTENGGDFATILGFLNENTKVFIQQVEDGSKYIILSITAAGTDNGNDWTFTVTVDNNGAIFDDGKECALLFYNSGSDNLGNHIATQNLNMANFNIVGASQITSNSGTPLLTTATNAVNTVLASNGSEFSFLTLNPTTNIASILVTDGVGNSNYTQNVDDFEFLIDSTIKHRLGTNGSGDGQITIFDNTGIGGDQLQLTARPTGSFIVSQGVTRLINYWATDHMFRIIGNTSAETFSIENVDTDLLFTAEGDGRLKAEWPNYETLVDADNVIPNRKWVEDRVLLEPLDAKDPTGFPDRTTSTISFNPGTRTFTIAPVATDYVYWQLGERHVINVSKDIVLPDVTAQYFIYFDAAETLQQQTSFDVSLLNDKTLVALVYWNAVESKVVLLCEERHGMGMSWNTHYHLHNSIGMRWYEGLNITVANDTLAFTNGMLADEDIVIDVTHNATPTAIFEQILTPVANLPTIYKAGTIPSTRWVKVDASAEFIYRIGGIPQWNELVGNTYQLTDIDNLDYGIYWIFGTNDIDTPIYSVMGTTTNGSLEDIRTGNPYQDIDFLDFPSEELKVLYRIIIQRDDTETLNFKVIESLDLRGEVDKTLEADQVPIDHGQIQGLLDDDHPQYLNEARGDARYYTESEIDGFFNTLSIDDLLDVDTTTTPPLTGAPLFWDGANWIPNTTARYNVNGCFIDFIDDSGLDFCVEQVGGSGSAFYIAKKSLGTIASPTAVLDGTKVGGYSFLAYDGGATSNPGYVGAQMAGRAVGDQTALNGGMRMVFEVTPQDTKSAITALEIEDDGTLNVSAQTDYETKVTDDDDIPNKKYVDDKLVAADLSTVSVRRTGSLNPIPTGWTDFDWDTTDEQNNTAVIEYTGTPADEIDIKEAGLYWVEWAVSADDECDIRLTNNGTVVAGSFHSTGDKGDTNQILTGNEKGRAYTLSVGTLVMQIQATTTAEFTIADSATLCVWRMTGPKGDTGAQGPQGPAGNPGGTINTNQGGSPFTGSPHDTINWSATDFVLNDQGNGTYDVAVNFPSANVDFGEIKVVDNGAGDLATNYNINGAEVALVLTGTVTNTGQGSTYFTNASGSITCNFDGTIRVTYSVPHTSAAARAALKCIVQINGSNVGSPEYSYIRNNNGHDRDTNADSDSFSVSNGDVVRIGVRRMEGSSVGGAINLLTGCKIIVERTT